MLPCRVARDLHVEMSRGGFGVCEYCGCQALEAVAELTAEHDLVVELGRQARAALRAGDLDGAAERSRALARILGPHTAVEEEALFPALRDEFPEHVSDLLVEHRLVESALGEAAETTPVDPGWPDRLDAVIELLRRHILKEQDGVFPAALAHLDPQEWEAVEAIRTRVGSVTRART
jgi:hemerythrin-like domain-containing protein